MRKWQHYHLTQRQLILLWASKQNCVLLEQTLGKDLLYLACHHNVIEHLSEAAYETTMGASSEPEVILLKDFKVQWGALTQRLMNQESLTKVLAQ